ncbi:TetR family transcriptional regulator [Kribbella sp. DT2]|uniref:TetR family transcriptional regulator n=1 Tax=Kribbella sp. DT2 TaxID=3393427 RepID=UPI003CFAE5D1
MERIRDAAVLRFGRDGFPASLRTIAADAGVTAGLVVHHFGSKDGLRRACDEHVLGVIRSEKLRAATASSAAGMLAQLAEVEQYGPFALYAVRSLQAGGELATTFIEQMVRDAEQYLTAGVEAGTIRPSRNPAGRAKYLTYQNVGSLMLWISLRPETVSVDDIRSALREISDQITLPALELFTEGLFVFAVATGSLSDSVTDAVAENPTMGQMFARNGLDPTDGFYSTMALFFALLIAAFAVTSVLRLRSEERTGHTEAVLATAVSRRRWISAWVGFTVLAAIVLLLVSGLGVGLAAALFGLRPGLAVWAWLLVGHAFFFGTFGALLDLPSLVVDLSPFSHLTVMPPAGLEATPLIALTVIGGALTFVGRTLFSAATSTRPEQVQLTRSGHDRATAPFVDDEVGGLIGSLGMSLLGLPHEFQAAALYGLVATIGRAVMSCSRFAVGPVLLSCAPAHIWFCQQSRRCSAQVVEAGESTGATQ